MGESMNPVKEWKSINERKSVKLNQWFWRMTTAHWMNEWIDQCNECANTDDYEQQWNFRDYLV
jgi:hypothetical protein